MTTQTFKVNEILMVPSNSGGHFPCATFIYHYRENIGNSFNLFVLKSLHIQIFDKTAKADSVLLILQVVSSSLSLCGIALASSLISVLRASTYFRLENQLVKFLASRINCGRRIVEILKGYPPMH